MAAIARLDLDEVLEHFEDLEDPRSSVNRLHPLSSVVVIAILGVLAGSNGPTAIADWAKTKGRFLEKLLELPHGIPSKDVFRRVLMNQIPDKLSVARRRRMCGWSEEYLMEVVTKQGESVR